jgi:hypothetical protein
MNCLESKELIPGLVMDALEEAEAAPLQEHLSGCADCRHELEETKSQLSILGQWQAPAAPADLGDRTMAKLQAEIAASESSWFKSFLNRIDLGLQKLGAHRPTMATGFVTAAVAGFLCFQVISPNWMRGRSTGAVTGCRNNLRLLNQALDQYAAKNQGQYPKKIEDLSPSYLQKFPDCPNAGHSTYSGGYQVSADGHHFTLNCQGNFHREAGLPDNQPELAK